jgi:hypothetical protein
MARKNRPLRPAKTVPHDPALAFVSTGYNDLRQCLEFMAFARQFAAELSCDFRLDCCGHCRRSRLGRLLPKTPAASPPPSTPPWVRGYLAGLPPGRNWLGQFRPPPSPTPPPPRSSPAEPYACRNRRLASSTPRAAPGTVSLIHARFVMPSRQAPEPKCSTSLRFA